MQPVTITEGSKNVAATTATDNGAVGTAADVTKQRLPKPRTHSLNAVRAIIPKSCYERPVGKAVAALIQGALLYLVPMVGLIMFNQWWAVLALWALTGLGVAGLFVLGHDASHNALVDNRKANRIIAQFCLAPSLHVEAAWDLGHNRVHHGYTTREGFDFVWHPATVADYQQMTRYQRMMHRIEWSAFGSGVYYLRTVWWQKMWAFTPEGKRRATIVADKRNLSIAVAVFAAVLVALGFLSGGWLMAMWMPVKVIVVPAIIFMHIIGWTVYVHHVDPDIRWWPKTEWNQFKGQMESTTILRIPTVINKLWMYNIFVHVPHHVDARIPFHQLPAAADAIVEHFPDVVRTGKWSASAYFRAATTCKLYDFEAGTWLPYSAAGAAPVAEPAESSQ